MNITEKALLASKSMIKSNRSLPKISTIEVKLVPQAQKTELFFSDALHLSGVAGGFLPKAQIKTSGSRVESGLTKRISVKDYSQVVNGIRNFRMLEGPVVAFIGSDIGGSPYRLKTTRTFLPSQLENDVKYRLTIHEFYMDCAELVVKFSFNGDSAANIVARESLLRLNKVPCRLVKRLVDIEKGRKTSY